MRYQLIAACCALFVGCASGPEAPVTQTKKLELAGVEGAVQPLLNEAPKAPALVVGVFENGVEKYYTFGTMGPEADENTTFRIGSLTKPFTATLVATYVSDNTITYDTSVNAGPCEKGKTGAFCFRGDETTYQHLIQHTSGLPKQPTNFETAQNYDEGKMQDFLSGFELFASPGFNHLYSSTGYYALAMILERRTSKPVAESIERRVLKPLDLTATTFEPKDLIQGYENGAEVADIQRSSLSKPSGGLASTAADLMKFVRINLDPGATGGMGQPIEFTQRTTQSVTAFETSVPAHGWYQMRENKAFWHAGSAPGYHGFMAFDRDNKKAVVLLMNTSVPAGDARSAIAAFKILAMDDVNAVPQGNSEAPEK